MCGCDPGAMEEKKEDQKGPAKLCSCAVQKMGSNCVHT